MNLKKVRFSSSTKDDFYSTVKARVHQYFQETGLSTHANAGMVFKTIFMFSIYFVPYGLMVSGIIQNPVIHILLWIVMGLGMAGIGLSVAHDALHGAYSSNPSVNKLIGKIFLLVGADDNNWKLQHNVLHHTYTNIHDLDEDIQTTPVMRFSPNEPLRPIHKGQYLYAWFFYGLMTLYWSTVKDFAQLFRYEAKGLNKSLKKPFSRLFVRMVANKILYYTFILVIPMLTFPFAWWQILIGYVLMHFIAGLILACIFQPAHVMPSTTFPNPPEGSTVENTWATHQLYTTTNFAPQSKFFSWFVGGLNFQIEHHLFPNICHVHYNKLSKIVKETALEFNLPYHSAPTFSNALAEHTRLLYRLGRG